MHDTKERLSLFWLFALLNYLYADVLALFFIVGSQDPAPHLEISPLHSLNRCFPGSIKLKSIAGGLNFLLH